MASKGSRGNRRNDKKSLRCDEVEETFAGSSDSTKNRRATPISQATTHGADDPERSAVAFRETKDDALIWEQPGFDKAEFYAAAQYLQRHEKNQGLYKSNDTQKSTIRNGLPTDKDACEMLDCLALLFARVKWDKTSPEHVTATALKTTEQRVEIWVAKNHGPRVLDEEFRADIEDWFNKKGAWSKDESLMAKEIAYFWHRRLDYYSTNIITLWNQICPVDPEKQKQRRKKGKEAVPDSESEGDLSRVSAAYVSLRTLYEVEKADLHLFESDWKKVKAICMRGKLSFDDIIQVNEDMLPTEKQSYLISSEGNHKEHIDMTRRFSKLLKHTRLLGTIDRAIRAFTKFRQSVKTTRIELMFIDAIDCPSLSADELDNSSERLRRWMRSTTNLQFEDELQCMLDRRESTQDVGKEHKNVADKPKTLGRYFHCELQLLDKFLNDTSKSDYFGCSKLSCYMCWGVLRGSPFRTRDTHANLWSACAFPFNLKGPGSNKRYEILYALKRTQDHIVGRVLRRSVDPQFKLGDVMSVAETWPKGELWDRDGTRTRYITLFHDRLRVMRTRAIRIPEIGEPVPEMVDFVCSSDRRDYNRPTFRYDSDTHYERIIPYPWTLERKLALSDVRAFVSSEQVTVDDDGSERSEIRICARRNGGSSTIRGANQWYMSILMSTDDHERKLLDPVSPWKGDLYVYRNVPRRFESEVRPIELEEMADVIRKTREVMFGL